MQELIDQLIIILKGIWLKKHYIVIIAALICPIGWLLVASMPDQYESSAKVNVDTQSLLRPLLRGLTVQPNADLQVRLIARTLFTRPNLERIAQLADLNITTISDLEMDKVLEELESSLTITTSDRSNIFNISYTAEDPKEARAVVQSALDVFIERTMGENRTDSDKAGDFLETQIQEYEDRLLEDERKLTEFKQNNAGITGANVGDYYSGLQAQKARLEEARLQLREVDSKLRSARAQLKGEEPTFGIIRQRQQAANYPTQYDARIDALQRTLDELSLKYTDRHPNIIELKRRVEDLKVQQSEEVARLQEASALEPQNSGELDSNPVYQQMKLNVTQLENERVSLAVRVREYTSKVKEFEDKIHLIPEIESQLISLNRGYEITKGKYNELLSRREQARLSQSADLTVDDIQFKVVDPPRVPLQPVGPNHILFSTMVMVTSIMAGIGIAFLLSQINPVALTANQLQMVTGIPVFGLISMASGTKATLREQVRYHSFWIGFFIILVAYVALVLWHLELFS